MSDVVTKKRVRKSVSRDRDVVAGTKPKVVLLKTRMNNLVVGGSGILIDKNDMMKLSNDFEDVNKAIHSATLGVVNSKDIINLNHDSRFYLEAGKYYGNLSKTYTKVAGCDKYEVKFFKVLDGQKLLNGILENLESTVGLKVTFTNSIIMFKNGSEYSFDLTTVCIKLTNDSWDVKRRLGKIYDIDKGNYKTDDIRIWFTGNQYFIAQEYMSNVEVANEINLNMNTCVDNVTVSTIKEVFTLPKADAVVGRLLFGRIQ